MKTYFSSERWVQAYAFYLRTLVFIQEQGIDPRLEFDSLDTDDRKYVVMTDRGKPIGTIRYQASADKTLQPDRLCVLKDYRNQHIGQQLMAVIEEQGRLDGLQFSELSAELDAVSFYQKLSYTIASDTFIEDGMPCVKMTKKLLVSDY